MSKDVKFARLLGVQRAQQSSVMELPFSDNVQNHIGNMHASAQFGLAEIASGDFLRRHFPELDGKAMAVVRRAEIKYSKAVDEDLQAFAWIEEQEESRFRKQLADRSRALLSVHVKLKTADEETATSAVYHWFISM